jgi:hypothetical protein
LVNIQPYAKVSSESTVNYEKAGLIIQAKTNDPSTLTIHRDMVAADLRGMIVPTNPSGRVWGVNAQAIIQAGGDGYALAAEFGIVNGGSDQPAVNTITSKYVLHLIAGGNGATSGIMFTGSGGGFHKGIFMNPADILGTDPADSFIELLAKWRVKKDGFTGIGTGAPLHKLHVLGAHSLPSLSAISGIVAIDGGTGTNQLTIGSYGGLPFGVWLQTKDNANGAGSGNAYPLSLNPLGGNVGIGIGAPTAKLHVAGGDVAVSSQGSGIILRATDGSTYFRVTVNSLGVISAQPVTFP